MRSISPLVVVAVVLAACSSTEPAAPVAHNYPYDYYPHHYYPYGYYGYSQSAPVILDHDAPDVAAEAREDYYRDDLDTDIRELERESLKGRLDPMDRRELLDRRMERSGAGRLRGR